MIDITTLRRIYAEKLLKTDSMDAALTKALWEAYKQGLRDAPGQSEEPPPLEF